MNEDGSAVARKDYVGSAGELSLVKPEPQPSSVKCASESDLRLRITAAYARHHA